MKTIFQIKTELRGDVQAQVIQNQATVDIASFGLRDDAALTEAGKAQQSLLQFIHRSNSLHIAVLAASLFPTEQTKLGAITRLRALFDSWLEDTQTVYQLGMVERNKRTALRNQHLNGVFNYQYETQEKLERLNKRIAKWIETEGQSECGIEFNDLVQKGHKRENLLKLYPPKFSLEELQAQKDELLEILEQIREFMETDIPKREFLDSMPKHFLDMRARNYTGNEVSIDDAL